MTKRSEPAGWEQVLVRHILPAKWDDLFALSPLVRAPFSCGWGTYEGERDLSLLPHPSGRWALAPRFARQSWLPLFSNAATAKQLFDTNADSRRMEVAWVGCQPDGAGWFFHVQRAGKPFVDFAQSVEAVAEPSLLSGALEPGLLDGCKTGEQAFQRLCAHFGISLPVRQVCVTERGFVVVGGNGKPLRSGLRGYLFTLGPALAAGANAASDALAEAIDHCDRTRIRTALERGPSLTHLPNTSVSPLLPMLNKCGKCDQARWEACLELLLAGGCPIAGLPNGNPPIVDCVQNLFPDRAALKMVKFLLAHGANVNATNPGGETALFQAAVDGSVELVRFLAQHDADPNKRTTSGASAIAWLRARLRELPDPEDESPHAEILGLLTAQVSGLACGRIILCAIKSGKSWNLLPGHAPLPERQGTASMPWHFGGCSG